MGAYSTYLILTLTIDDYDVASGVRAGQKGEKKETRNEGMRAAQAPGAGLGRLPEFVHQFGG